MLDSLIASVNAIFPIMLMMFTGSALKRIDMMHYKTCNNLNSIVYNFLLPVTMFISIYDSDLSQAINPKVIGYALVIVFVALFILCVLIPKIYKDPKQQGVIIIGMLRGNIVLFGLPIAKLIYGADKVGTVTVLMAIVVPLLNMLSVIVYESTLQKEKSIKSMIKGIVYNPLIIASVLGIIVKFLSISVPTFLYSFLNTMGGMASPLALMVLGANFEINEVAQNKKPLITIILGKLVVLPLIAIIGAYFLGFTGETMLAVMIIFAAPNAVSNYSLAIAVDADYKLAGQALALTTMLCIVTLFIFVFSLTYLQLI